MAKTELSTIILAAGHGTRMRSSLPKVMHQIAGRPMLHHVMATAQALGSTRQVVVVGVQAPQVGDAAKAFDRDAAVAVQDPPQGTGDAVKVAMPQLEGAQGIAIILYADTPLITEETLRQLIDKVESQADVAVLGFEAEEPGAYGRLILGRDGDLERIVEAKDASPDELAVTLCNSGVMAVRIESLREYLPQITNENAKKEYYLTDLIGLVTGAGKRAAVVTGSSHEVLGVNNRQELSVAESVFQDRCRARMMEDGVTLVDPQTVYFSYDTLIASDVTVAPNVVFGPGVVIETGARIEAFSHLEGCIVREGAGVGPFARIRPGSDLGPGAKVGNFVETKKAVLGAGAKVSHLTYLGDAKVGAEANIGAGTITCNYDGFGKFVTEIGSGAFVGSNSALVAPVKIGDGAYIGSGSVVTKDVAPDALAVGRGRQVEKAGWAASFRARRIAETGDKSS